MIDDIIAKYPNDVRVVIKQFPLGFHKQARKAALYALAAERQGRYKAMSDKIFTNYRNLKSNEDLPRQYAQKLGLDMAKFDKDMQDPALDVRITREISELQRSGIPRMSVPKFLINGKEPIGGRDLTNYSVLIDLEIMHNKVFNIPIGDSFSIGPEDASVTIIEWIDFQSQYCVKTASLVNDIANKYPNDVRIVIKHFPQYSRELAKYSIAAERQGRFIEMYNKIMRNYVIPQSFDKIPLQYARDLGMYMPKMHTDMEDPVLNDRIVKEMKQLEQSRIPWKVLPMVLINGKVPMCSTELTVWDNICYPTVENYSTIIDAEIKN